MYKPSPEALAVLKRELAKKEELRLKKLKALEKAVPKLPVPANARRGIFFFGTQSEIMDLVEMSMQERRPHTLARLDNGKWTTETHFNR